MLLLRHPINDTHYCRDCSITLQFSIGEALPITITVLDDQGQPITTLTNQTYPAGSHEVGWDASDRKPGVYFVQWTLGEQRVTRKVVIE